MRLFGVPDGVVDEQDRASWLTMPFDLEWIVVGPYRTVAAGTFRSGSVIGQEFHAGADAAGSFVSGAIIGQGSE